MATSGEGDRSSTAFDPLLRELLAFNLVEVCDSDGGAARWRLSSMAEARLAQLAAPPPPEDKVVYFSRRCVRCGDHRPTRRRPEGFVCDGCWVERTEFVRQDVTGLSA